MRWIFSFMRWLWNRISILKKVKLQEADIGDIEANRQTTKKGNKPAQNRQAHCLLSCASSTIYSRRHDAAHLHAMRVVQSINDGSR